MISEAPIDAGDELNDMIAEFRARLQDDGDVQEPSAAEDDVGLDSESEGPDGIDQLLQQLFLRYVI